MFGQLFGKYLVDHEIISKEALDGIIDKMASTRAKLGVIAVANGYITEKQAEEINRLQTQHDARFGDIAISEGYITDEQLEKLLKDQGSPYIKFVQLLSEETGIAISDIDNYIHDFRKEMGFDEKELEALKQEDIDRIVPVFAFSSKPFVTNIVSLVLRNITRFVSSNYYIGRIEHIDRFEYRCLAGQKCEGDNDIMIGFAVKNDKQAFIDIANGYTKANLTELGAESFDAVGEFVNCISGLCTSALSKKNINVEIMPQFAYENQVATGDAYVVPIYINGSVVFLYIAIDSNIVVGTMPVTRRMQAAQGSVNTSDSKGTAVIVDDSGMSRRMLRNILEEDGFTVVAEATDGLEGLLAYKQYSPDILTLDITMPNMDGIECLQNVMEYDSSARVIMITAAGQQHKVIQALKLGAKKFLTKPYKKEEVLKEINDMMQG